MQGFDELVLAADEAIGTLGVEAFAQIGHSRAVPKNMPFERFLPHSRLVEQLEVSRVLIAHAGVGLIMEGLDAGCRVIVFPRRGSNSRRNPINDQTQFARRLAGEVPIVVCQQPERLAECVRTALASPEPVCVRRKCEAPGLIADFLARN
ncbi:MAG: glycosyltransferase [Geminicoccaceae bacterium]